MISQHEFRAYILGYLHLDIGRWRRGEDEFEKLIRGEDEFSILHGRYVGPWAQSILKRNSVDGLILDTTWKVIRKYVTTIVMAVYRNVGVPLGFAFGTAETVELHEQDFGAFNHIFEIDFNHYILKSDQGSPLCLLCTNKGQVQLFYLSHFLLSLKQKEVSCQIGNLVKGQTEGEFESLRRMSEVEFQKVVEPNRRKLSDRTLVKAGLGYTKGWLIITEDGARWNAVSMWKRVDSRMPRTTNTFEATHDHRNDIITRRNSLWRSLTILVDSIANKMIGFDAALAHDFRASLKRSKRRSQLVSPNRMAEECAFFGTSCDSCGRAEIVHLSSSYRADLPCGHRYSLEARSQTSPMGWGSSCNQASRRWTIPRLFTTELVKR